MTRFTESNVNLAKPFEKFIEAAGLMICQTDYLTARQPMTIDWNAFTNRTLTTAEVRLLGAVDLPSVLALQKLMLHEVR